jgi:hypothetical protein
MKIGDKGCWSLEHKLLRGRLFTSGKHNASVNQWRATEAIY